MSITDAGSRVNVHFSGPEKELLEDFFWESYAATWCLLGAEVLLL